MPHLMMTPDDFMVTLMIFMRHWLFVVTLEIFMMISLTRLIPILLHDHSNFIFVHVLLWVGSNEHLVGWVK